jgi:predicted DNA-binding protein
MIRMMISMPPETKQWLEEYSRRHHLSAAEVIRRAIEHYRRKGASPKSSRDVLSRTQGKWISITGDSQAHVDKIRNEWDRRR